MNTLSKVVISSSLVLGAALFSIGCGGEGSCCDGNSVNAKVTLLDSNNFSSTNTLPLNQSILAVNGLNSTSNSNIVKAVWTAYSDCSKDTAIATQTVTSKDTAVNLDLGTAGTHKVCVVVTDVNGLTDEDCSCITVQESNGPSAVISGLPGVMKVGCPLPALSGANSISHSNSGQIRSYAWTLDGASAGSAATPSLPTNLTGTPNPHEVCLTVTDSNGDTNMKCDNLTVQPHVNPHAEIHIFKNQNNTDEVQNGGDLNFNAILNVTCSGSHDDCPITANGRSIPQYDNANNGTCDFNGASFQSTAADCSVEPAAGVMLTNNGQFASDPANATETATAPYWYRENCKLTEELTQTSNTAGVVRVSMCGTPVFNCVKFWVDVTDTFGGSSRAEKVFRVQ